MIWRKYEGGICKIGFNYQWKDANTLFALDIVFPIFIRLKHYYHDWYSGNNYCGKGVVCCSFGFRYRIYRKEIWETFKQRFIFRSFVTWFKPFGKQIEFKLRDLK